MPLSRLPLRLYSTMSSMLPTSSPFTRAVVNSMRKLYPESLAEKSFDNTGLLLEAPFHPSRRQNNSVLLTIDLTKAVADEAIARKDSVVVAYHPIIFRGLKSLTLNDTQQQSLLRLASEGISVYSPHTAVDAAPGGMADWLCDIVTGAIIPDGPLPPEPSVPSSTPFPGAFKYTNPTYPHPSSITLIPNSHLPLHQKSTIHPSPAPLPDSMSTAGMGRLVTFDEPQRLTTLVGRIARSTGYPGGIQIALPQSVISTDAIDIETVGVCPGSGSSVFLKAPVLPQLLLTGELSHHEALSVVERGSVVIALAHSNSERGYLRGVMAAKLREALEKEWAILREEEGGWEGEPAREGYEDASVRVDVSEKDRDPYGVMVRVQTTNLLHS